jgi:biotin synthase-related radical SAM superfamily protein
MTGKAERSLGGLDLRSEVNVSIGTAVVLGLADVKMDAAPTTAYLMLGGRCNMACAFCAQARTSSARAINLSRITWPPFDEGEVLDRLGEAAARGDFRRVCLQVTAGQDSFRRTLELVEAVRGICDLPVDAAILPHSVGQVKILLDAGVEHIGFGLDAACERVFRRVKRARPEPLGFARDKLRRRGDWERNLKLVEESARRFPGHVAVHLIVGLGETEQEIAELIQRMHDLEVIVGLFAFTPVRGTLMQDQPPPPLDTYRRMQVARHLISHDLSALGDFAFSAEGRLVSFSQPDLAEVLADGVAFQTSGCPDCNRPFYNERPGGPLYNYPRPLTSAEVLRAVSELALAGDYGG